MLKYCNIIPSRHPSFRGIITLTLLILLQQEKSGICGNNEPIPFQKYKENDAPKIIDGKYLVFLRPSNSNHYSVANLEAQGNSSDTILEGADSISTSGILNNKINLIDKYLQGPCSKNSPNLWSSGYWEPEVIEINQDSIAPATIPKDVVINRKMRGSNNDILLLTNRGIYISFDGGMNWIIKNGNFPEIPEPLRVTLDGDTTWYNFAEMSVKDIYRDAKGRYWAGCAIGLIFSDDYFNTWHVFLIKPGPILTYMLRPVRIIGMNSKNELILWTLKDDLWLFSTNKKTCKHIYGFESSYKRDFSPRNYFRDAIFCNEIIAFVDADVVLATSEGCFPPQKWLESKIKVSENYGLSWKEYSFGEGVEIFGLKLSKKYLFADTSLGMKIIPLNCFK
jgi:hypothetical protein